MRIATFTITSLLTLACSVALADTPVQQVHQDNIDIHQLNRDIRANEGERSGDRQVAADQRYDLGRDRADRDADQAREDRDLAKGDYKGAAYWKTQRNDQNDRVVAEKKDLSHTRKDLRSDNSRIKKDENVRHHDVVKRNKAARKI